jgi:ankyrin repeat protein
MRFMPMAMLVLWVRASAAFASTLYQGTVGLSDGDPGTPLTIETIETDISTTCSGPLPLDVQNAKSEQCIEHTPLSFDEIDLDEVGRLIQEGHLNVDASDKDGLPLISWVVQRNLAELFLLLVERGADLNACDPTGSTPLHHIVRLNRLQMAKALLAIYPMANNNVSPTPHHMESQSA